VQIRATIVACRSAEFTIAAGVIMQIILYYAPTTCALAPYITLTEAGADFEVRRLNLRKNEHNSPEYLKLNPKHKVPLLVVDGKVLSESVAIQPWIARTFPQAKLLPSDPWQELQAISLMSWFSGGIHPFLARINAPVKVCDVPGADASVKKIATANLMELFKVADDRLAGREFFFDHFTAPDAHFFWCQRRARQFDIDFAGFKNCSAHFARMQQRPSVKKLLAFEKSVLDDFAKAA
jgi:glutathione S-transferase